MKKILLIATSVLLFSCTANEELETTTTSDAKAKELAFQKAKKEGLKQSPNDGVTFKCGSTSYLNPINVNPNYPYISNYEVIFWDGSPLYGRNQKYLSNFVGDALFGSNGPFISVTQVFTGSATYSDFMNSTTGNILEYTYGQDSDNASFYGDIFPNSGPMTNDAANTVYHHFKTIVDQHISQGRVVKAAHFQSSALLCIPSGKFIRMSLKLQ